MCCQASSMRNSLADSVTDQLKRMCQPAFVFVIQTLPRLHLLLLVHSMTSRHIKPSLQPQISQFVFYYSDKFFDFLLWNLISGVVSHTFCRILFVKEDGHSHVQFNYSYPSCWPLLLWASCSWFVVQTPSRVLDIIYSMVWSLAISHGSITFEVISWTVGALWRGLIGHALCCLCWLIQLHASLPGWSSPRCYCHKQLQFLSSCRYDLSMSVSVLILCLHEASCESCCYELHPNLSVQWGD